MVMLAVMALVILGVFLFLVLGQINETGKRLKDLEQEYFGITKKLDNVDTVFTEIFQEFESVNKNYDLHSDEITNLKNKLEFFKIQLRTIK